MVGRILGELIFFQSGELKAFKGLPPSALFVTRESDFVGERGGTIGVLFAFPRQFQVRIGFVVVVVPVPSIPKKVSHLDNCGFIQSTRFCQKWRGVVLQSVELPRGMQELGDVQRHQFFEVRVIGDAFKTIECNAGLAIEVSNVREVIFRRGLKASLHIEDVVELHSSFFVALLFKQTVPELEAVLVALIL